MSLSADITFADLVPGKSPGPALNQTWLHLKPPKGTRVMFLQTFRPFWSPQRILLQIPRFHLYISIFNNSRNDRQRLELCQFYCCQCSWCNTKRLWKTSEHPRCKWNHYTPTTEGSLTRNSTHITEISVNILHPWEGPNIQQAKSMVGCAYFFIIPSQSIGLSYPALCTMKAVASQRQIHFPSPATRDPWYLQRTEPEIIYIWIMWSATEHRKCIQVHRNVMGEHLHR